MILWHHWWVWLQVTGAQHTSSMCAILLSVWCKTEVQRCSNTSTYSQVLYFSTVLRYLYLLLIVYWFDKCCSRGPDLQGHALLHSLLLPVSSSPQCLHETYFFLPQLLHLVFMLPVSCLCLLVKLTHTESRLNSLVTLRLGRAKRCHMSAGGAAADWSVQ